MSVWRPKVLDGLVGSFAAKLSTPVGFVLVNVGMGVGCLASAMGLATESMFTLTLSVFAITISNAVLVAQSRDTLAVHLKLDELLRTQEAARDAVIGAEHKSKDELEDELSRLERAVADAGPQTAEVSYVRLFENNHR